MADTEFAPAPAAPPAPTAAATRPLSGPVAFLLLTRMWSRAAWQYRASLLLTGTAQTLTTCLDLVGLLIMYSQVKTLAGFTLAQTLYLYGTTRLAFACADVVASGVEGLGESIRLGTFDAMLIRPVGTLPQVLADQFTPKRFGKLIPSTATLVWAVTALPITWTPAKAAVCVCTVICGAVIYSALFVLTSTINFVITDAAETANVLTYGGELFTEYPLGIYRRPLALLFTFAIPLAFVTWEPSLYVLGKSDPLGLPSFLRFAAPVVALLLSAVTGLTWRAAVRRYRSTGS